MDEPKNKKMKKGEDEKRKKKRSDIDGGYGWVVIAGCFFVHMLQIGYLRAFGLLFVQFLDEFKAPVSVTSTVMGIQSAIFSITSLFVLNLFINYWSIRGYAIVGSVVGAAGVAISAFAPNVEFLIFSQSILIGVGNAFSYGPGIVLIGRYFKKRLALANSLANAGVSAGAIIMPLLISYLLEEYALRGSLIVLGGVMFQGVICAALYRSPTTPKEQQRVNVEEFKSLESFYSLGPHAPSKQDLRQTSVNTDSLSFRDRLNSNTVSPEIINSKFIFRDRANSNKSDRARTESRTDHTAVVNKPVNKFLLRGQSVDASQIENKSDSQMSGSKFVNKSILRAQSVDIGIPTHARRRFISESQPTTDVIESLSHSQLLLYTSDLSLVYASMLDLKNHTVREDEDEPEVEAKCTDKLKNILDLSLFRNPMFWIVAGFTPLAMCGSALSGAYIPALAKEIGLEDSQGSLMLTISGSLDIISRLVPGIISEFGILKRQYMVLISLVVLGIIFQFSSFFNSFMLLMVFSCAYGLFGGVYFSLLSVVIIDILTFENFPKAFGFVQVFHGASAAICYPVLGLLKDLTGTYNTCFQFLGACMLGGALVLSFEPLARRRYNASLRKDNESDETKVPLKQEKNNESIQKV